MPHAFNGARDERKCGICGDSREGHATPILMTLADARRALSSDKLGTVYIRAQDVYVVTAFGSGTFPRREWDNN